MPPQPEQPTETAPVDAGRTSEWDAFAEFVSVVEPRLRRALAGWSGSEAHDATAEALAWAWENWERVQGLTNPAGYLYRVAQSKSRSPKQGLLPHPGDIDLPHIEPDLVPALLALPDKQRVAVWLVHGCGWSYVECAEAMEISASAVGTHVSRALEALRRRLEVDHG